jgi:hypothetical protein
MIEPLPCTHLTSFLLEKLLKLVQGFDDAIGVDRLTPGDIIGEHHPHVAKEGQSLASMD